MNALVDFAGRAVVISHDRFFLTASVPHMVADGDAHVEGNLQDYEADKIRRLGPDAVDPSGSGIRSLQGNYFGD